MSKIFSICVKTRVMIVAVPWVWTRPTGSLWHVSWKRVAEERIGLCFSPEEVPASAWSDLSGVLKAYNEYGKKKRHVVKSETFKQICRQLNLWPQQLLACCFRETAILGLPLRPMQPCVARKQTRWRCFTAQTWLLESHPWLSIRKSSGNLGSSVQHGQPHCADGQNWIKKNSTGTVKTAMRLAAG